MEHIGAICEGEWSSLSGMYSNEEADFMAQFLANCPPSDELDGSTSLGNQSTLWPSYGSTMNMAGVNQNSYFSFDIGNNTSSLWFSQGSSYNGASSALFPSSSQESYYLSDSNPILITNHSCMSMDFCVGDTNNTSSYLIEGDDCSNQEMSDGTAEDQSGGSQSVLGLDVNILPPKMESEMQAPEPVTDENLNNPSKNSKKRSRNLADVQKKRNVRSKKNQKAVSTSNDIEEENNNNASLNRPTSSSCSSEDDSNASQEPNGGETSSMSSKGKADLNLNGKTRASRGSASDPQSLYARKRRERINERLRILQNLVPNGTKVDISTMLEEAVQYVKFLQLQIKLLSSDDLWMYAPIAYNGLNIGLDHLKVTTPKLS